MCEFFERIGQRIMASASCWWQEVQPRVWLSFPYYRVITPDAAEIDRFLREVKPRALRYPTPIDAYGFDSTIPINTSSKYDLSNLHQKARNQTRRALENCTVEQISFDDLARHGLELNRDTAVRQGRESEYANPGYWKTYCAAGKSVEGYTAWGAFVEGQLGAYLICAEFDGWSNWLVENSRTSLLSKRPNNALVYVTARHFKENTDNSNICYGLGSLEQVEALDRFKQRMGWTCEPVKQRIVLSRSMRLAFGLMREPALRLLNTLLPQSYVIRKASAMVRHYRRQHPS